MISKVVKDNADQQYIPEYTFTLEGELLTVRPIKSATTAISNQLAPLQSDTYEEARKYAAGWDIRRLETEWRGWVYSKNIKVRNADSNFIIQWAVQTRGTILR